MSKYLLKIFPTELVIEGEEGVYSSVWEDYAHKGPYYPCIQKHILKSVTQNQLNRILTLGGAGCSFPRFFVANYSSVDVVVIDYCENMINVAKQYFLPADCTRIHCICTDAFNYVEDCTIVFDLILVDLFNKDKLVSGIFELKFYENLYNILSNDGVIYINAWGITECQYSCVQDMCISRFEITHIHQLDTNFIFLRKK